MKKNKSRVALGLNGPLNGHPPSVYYVTMRITFVTREFGKVERNSHCDVLHIAPVRVARLVMDCNGVFAIKAYCSRTLRERPRTMPLSCADITERMHDPRCCILIFRMEGHFCD